MISSSYFPPSLSPSRSSKSEDTTRSPNFDAIPTAELLSSAPTRSAFLQSLQRSREREERREKEIASDKYSDKYGYGSNEYKSTEASDYKASEYKASDYKASDYKASEYKASDYKGSEYKASDYKASDYAGSNYEQKSTVSSTPIMSRRRLSSSPSSNPSRQSSSSLSTPPPPPALKPPTSSTPLSQSKLASHAFTMSRSSTEDEIDTANKTENDSANSIYGASMGSVSDFRRKYEEEYGGRSFQGGSVEAPIARPRGSVESSIAHPRGSVETPITRPLPYYSYEQSPISTPKPVAADLTDLVSSIVESHTATLKNDLQNLHIELIKQSVAQQSSFKSLLEMYLPLTGKLMASLSETREENERLKMRIEELERSGGRR